MCLFLGKRVFLDSFTGRLGVIFHTPPNISSKKSFFGVNLGAKSCEILIKGAFSMERGHRN